jgi:hypothetical protein
MARPFLLNFLKISKICPLTFFSNLPVGSSAISNFGSLTKARAIPVRCLSPPDRYFI